MTRATPKLERVAVRVARIVGDADCLLVGGLAVGAHGYVRATKDVDFAVRVGLKELSGRLRERGIATVLTRCTPLDGDFPSLTGTLDGVRFDLMSPRVPLDWSRAVEVRMAKGAILRVVDLDGLVRLKLRAQGPKDLLDVAALVLRHPELLPVAREQALAYRVADKLETWLADPRLKAEILQTTRDENRSRMRGARNASKRPHRKKK